MQTLTCPIPQNINPLQSNGFRFAINKLPTVTYFCQEVNLPSLDLPSAEIATSLVDYPIPGEKLTFGELNVQFLIDEDMTNYIAIHNWIVGLGFPRSHAQFSELMRNDNMNKNELMKGYSDGVLQILNSSNNPIRTIMFKDLTPTSLQSLQLQTTGSDTTYLAGLASFKYTLYEFS